MKNFYKIFLTLALIFLPVFSFAQTSPELTVSYSIGGGSAEAVADGFTPKTEITFYLINISTGLGEANKKAMADDAGVAQAEFADLKAGTIYQITATNGTQAASSDQFNTGTTGGGNDNPSPNQPKPTPSKPDPEKEKPYGGGGLVPNCSIDPVSGVCVWGWNELMKLVSTVINFLIFYLSLPIAAIAFAYAGFLLMTSGEDSGKRTKAKEIFKKVGLGLVIAMAAWLIVNTILTTLIPADRLEDFSQLEDL